MQTIVAIQNLKCGGCAATIKEKLSKADAVEKVEVDQDNSTVTISHHEGLSEAVIRDKLAALGYPADDANNSLLTKAKSYVSCATGKLSNS